MATYIDALNGKHSDGSEQFSDKITLLIRNVQYFEWEVHPDRIDEIGDWQSVIDLDFDPEDVSVEQVSDDYYEYVEVLGDAT